MIYIEKKPSKVLRKYIKCIWNMEYDGKLSASENERILPDGYTEIIINFSDKIKCKQEGGSQRILTRSFITGPFSRYIHLEPNGKIGLLGIRFWPGMMHTFLDIPMNELTNNYYDLSLIMGKFADEVEYKVHDAKDFDERFKILDTTLVQYMLGNFNPPNKTIEFAINNIINTNGLMSIEDLAEKIGIGTRQLQRLFSQKVGLSPKTFTKIIRFQRIFKELETDHISNWLILALQCGYYDQAHFIKEFKQFSGLTPTSYFSGNKELTQYFTTKIKMTDLYNTFI